jgi:hypothetical protein
VGLAVDGDRAVREGVRFGADQCQDGGAVAGRQELLGDGDHQASREPLTGRVSRVEDGQVPEFSIGVTPGIAVPGAGQVRFRDVVQFQAARGRDCCRVPQHVAQFLAQELAVRGQVDAIAQVLLVDVQDGAGLAGQAEHRRDRALRPAQPELARLAGGPLVSGKFHGQTSPWIGKTRAVRPPAASRCPDDHRPSRPAAPVL